MTYNLNDIWVMYKRKAHLQCELIGYFTTESALIADGYFKMRNKCVSIARLDKLPQRTLNTMPKCQKFLDNLRIE